MDISRDVATKARMNLSWAVISCEHAVVYNQLYDHRKRVQRQLQQTSTIDLHGRKFQNKHCNLSYASGNIKRSHAVYITTRLTVV